MNPTPTPVPIPPLNLPRLRHVLLLLVICRCSSRRTTISSNAIMFFFCSEKRDTIQVRNHYQNLPNYPCSAHMHNAHSYYCSWQDWPICLPLTLRWSDEGEDKSVSFKTKAIAFFAVLVCSVCVRALQRRAAANPHTLASPGGCLCLQCVWSLPQPGAINKPFLHCRRRFLPFLFLVSLQSCNLCSSCGSRLVVASGRRRRGRYGSAQEQGGCTEQEGGGGGGHGGWGRARWPDGEGEGEGGRHELLWEELLPCASHAAIYGADGDFSWIPFCLSLYVCVVVVQYVIIDVFGLYPLSAKQKKMGLPKYLLFVWFMAKNLPCQIIWLSWICQDATLVANQTNTSQFLPKKKNGIAIAQNWQG